jgi:hypothetical protein
VCLVVLGVPDSHGQCWSDFRDLKPPTPSEYANSSIRPVRTTMQGGTPGPCGRGGGFSPEGGEHDGTSLVLGEGLEVTVCCSGFIRC